MIWFAQRKSIKNNQVTFNHYVAPEPEPEPTPKPEAEA